MPPKKKATEPTKKTVDKQKQKVIEDKTFGIKNKRGTKQQKFIKMVTTQVQHGGNKSARLLEKEKQEKMSAKEKRQKELDDLNALLRPVQQAPGKGADPKSVLCAFFKQGQCKKGDKCKFSHDLNVSRKGEKRSMYEDTREEDSMENWDEKKLEEVVNQKHGESDKAKQTTTNIICKFFLEALENSKYGWFWKCPNGEGCKYRHALPPGFVLKKDKKKEDKEEEISMEELVERERAALGDNLTKVTLETFLKWKERKRKEKIQKANEETDKKKSDFKTGKMLGISGREMFAFNPDLVVGDDDGAEDLVYENEEDGVEEEGDVTEISIEALAAAAKEVDGTGTMAAKDRKSGSGATSNLPNGNQEDESSKLGMAAALPPDANKETDAAIAAAMSATVNGDMLAGDSPIDENLFDGEDLDLLEDELEELELQD